MQKFLSFLILILIPGFSLSENPEMKRVKEAIEEFKGAINLPNPEKMEEIWAEDAIFMPQGFEIIKGKKEIVEVWKRNIKSGFRTKDQRIIEMEIIGDTCYEVATHLWAMVKEGEEIKWHSSKYVHIWKKQKDGKWKLHLDIWNSNP
ncbi:MAG: DUF4440 domain-containing protein [Thermoanaerobaculia bacterium]